MPRLTVDPLAAGASLGPAIAIEALVSLVNAARLDDLAEIMAGGATLTAALDGSTTETVDPVDCFAELLERIPDLQQSIDWLVTVDEHTAVACLVWAGTPSATGRPFRSEGVVLKVAVGDDRRIRAAWIYFLDPTIGGSVIEPGSRGG